MDVLGSVLASNSRVASSSHDNNNNNTNNKRQKVDVNRVKLTKPISCTIEEDVETSRAHGTVPLRSAYGDIPLDALLEKVVQEGRYLPASATQDQRPQYDGRVLIPKPQLPQGPQQGQYYVPGFQPNKRKVSSLSEKASTPASNPSATTASYSAPMNHPFTSSTSNNSSSQQSVSSRGITTLPTQLPLPNRSTLAYNHGNHRQQSSLSSSTAASATSNYNRQNETVIVIGSAKLDTAKLVANSLVTSSSSPQQQQSQSSSSTTSSSSSSPASIASNALSLSSNKSKKLNPNEISDEEIQKLLNRKSSHATEVEDEWFKDYSKRMDKLGKREYYMAQNEATTQVHINAFYCKECALLTESIGPLCRPRGHTITSNISAIKRFFECSTCLKKEYTIGTSQFVFPSSLCPICGVSNWRACGIKGTELGRSDRRDASEKLITSATDWTSRKDLAKIKIMSDSM